MDGHKTIHLECGAMQGEIDENIAPLMCQIWRAGIATVMSCQENRPGIAWIEFLSAEDAERFLDAVAVFEEGVECLYNRIRDEWGHGDGSDPEGTWEYRVSVHDLSIFQEEFEDGVLDETCEGPPNFLIGISIRFPTTDLPILEERLMKHNEEVGVLGELDEAMEENPPAFVP